MEDLEHICRPSSEMYSISLGESSRVKEGRDSYMIYPIILNSNITSHHRYKDFEWLRRELNQKYPACSTPALPDKEGVSSYWTSQNSLFYKFRRHGLEQFLKKLLNHPKLSKSVEFQSFIQEDEIKFSIRVQNSENNSSWLGYISSIGVSLAGAVGSYMNTDYTDQGSEDFEFSSHKNEILAALTQQDTLCMQGRSLVTSEENEIMSSLALSKSYENMAKVEKQSLSDKLRLLAETHLQVSEVQKGMIEKLKDIVGEMMEDNKRFTQGLLEALDRRTKIKLDKEYLSQFDLRELDSDIREEIQRFDQEKNFISRNLSRELVLYKQELTEKISEIWSESYTRIKDRNYLVLPVFTCFTLALGALILILGASSASNVSRGKLSGSKKSRMLFPLIVKCSIIIGFFFFNVSLTVFR